MGEDFRTAGGLAVIALTVELSGATHDVVAELPAGATVGSLGRAIADAFDQATLHANIRVLRTGELLNEDAPAADCDLRSGDVVQLHMRSVTPPIDVALKPRPAVEDNDVRLRSGRPSSPIRPLAQLIAPDAAVDIAEGRQTVGSSAMADVNFGLEGLPPVAFELWVEGSSLRVRAVDDGEPISVEGTLVSTGWHLTPSGCRIRAGSAELVLRLNDPSSGPEDRPKRLVLGEETARRKSLHLGSAGEIAFNRPPRRSSPWRPAVLALPRPPSAQRRVRLPLAAALVPLVAGIVMFLLLKQVVLLAFIALSPLMAISTYVADRRSGRREAREAKSRFETELSAASEALYEAIRVEMRERHAQFPQLATIARFGADLDDRLWERRPWDADFLQLPLGWGRLPAMTEARTDADRVDLDPRVTQLVAQYKELDDLPYVIGLSGLSALGFAGDRATSADAARALVLQAVLRHSPANLAVGAALPRGAEQGWEWLKWLPHSRAGVGLLQGPALGTGSRGPGSPEACSGIPAAHARGSSPEGLLVLVKTAKVPCS